MGKSNLPTPDGLGRARFTDLQPGAKQVGAYQSDTAQSIPEVPTTNSLSQLGSALSGFSPTLVRLTAYATDIQENNDQAAALEKQRGDEAQNKNRRDLRTATEKGLIPAGANPQYIKTYNQAELDTRSMQYQNQLNDAYSKHDARNSDDPNAFEDFVAKQHADFRSSILYDGDKQKYTALEIRDSKFDGKLEGANASLRAQHLQHRVTERTKLGQEIASSNATVVLDKFFAPGAEKNPQATADGLVNSFFNPMTGLASNGLAKSEANKMMVDALVIKALELGDIAPAKAVADLIGTSEGNFLGKTGYAKTKFEAAEKAILTDKIRTDNFEWNRRERNALTNEGLTPEMQAKIKAVDQQHKTELWEQDARKYEHALFVAAKSERDSYAHITTEAHTSRILTGLTAKDMDNPKVMDSLSWLKEYNPDKWMTVNSYIKTFQKEASVFTPTTASAMATAKLRYEMSRSPGTFDSSRVLGSAVSGLIDPKDVSPLLDDWDKMKTHQDHPFLQSEAFKSTLSKAERAAVKDADDQFGVGALLAEKASYQLRSYGNRWVEENPNGKYSDFEKAIHGQLDQIVLENTATDRTKEKLTERIAPAKTETSTPKDTRSGYETVAPNFLGGKSKPKPETKTIVNPPMSPTQAFGLLRSDDNIKLQQILQDPNVDEEDAGAAIQYFLGPVMKSNGRNTVEISTLKDHLLSATKRRKPTQ